MVKTLSYEEKYQALKNKDIVLAGLLLLFLVSCQSPEHSFSSEELKTIDSLYNVRKDSVETITKTECESIFLEVYDDIVDSLIDVRRREIFEIIEE